MGIRKGFNGLHDSLGRIITIREGFISCYNEIYQEKELRIEK